MAKVKIEGVVEHLESEMRKALSEAVAEVAPSIKVNEHDLYRAFRRAMGRKCSTWEQVPDRYVDAE